MIAFEILGNNTEKRQLIYFIGPSEPTRNVDTLCLLYDVQCIIVMNSSYLLFDNRKIVHNTRTQATQNTNKTNNNKTEK